MPFDPFFWQKPGPRDVINTWNVGKDVKNALAPAKEPNDIQGFITALPIRWTWREHNRSGLNLTMLASNTLLPPDGDIHAVKESIDARIGAPDRQQKTGGEGQAECRRMLGREPHHLLAVRYTLGSSPTPV